MAALNALATAIAASFGSPMRQARRLHGGDLSEVFLTSLEDGRHLVAKAGPLVAAEAEMLHAIRTAGAPAPQVLGVAQGYLFLEALEETAASGAGWHALGLGLRKLHARRGAAYGWERDYAFGAVAIDNRPATDWPAFWGERRLSPSLPFLPPALARRLETLIGDLDDFLPAAPPAALLHGDLWTGNVLFGPAGKASLIDPACYFGDAEVDLAMLTLFGQPGRDFRESYGPLAPGHETRRALYQLWPALVHFRLFGAGYAAMVEERLTALRH
ncbi:MAG: fructosamine kinase family protein [Tropicimonas sp.]|uniref:fructosamine kinase family protein n=1 Tax=Tropicimonas sp. TaxID=2067044 RepID=UPI003A8BBF0A